MEAAPKAWTPEQAREQARRDALDQRLEHDPLELALHFAEMIINARSSEAYQAALANESPDLGDRIACALAYPRPLND
jgi:thioredoxin-like negative regulator of GroEL